MVVALFLGLIRCQNYLLLQPVGVLLVFGKCDAKYTNLLFKFKLFFDFRDCQSHVFGPENCTVWSKSILVDII